MASFSIPCPKICAPAANLQLPHSKPICSSVAFRPDSVSSRTFLSGSSLPSSSPILALQLRQPKPIHSAVAFRPKSISNRPFLFGSSLPNPILALEASNRNKHDVLRVSAQQNAVSVEEESNSIDYPDAKPEESTKISSSQDSIPDASSITAFMDQVSDLIELVDSRDIMELELKQENCEVLIRKKEALPQPPAAPYVMMQSPSHQTVAPPSPPAQASTRPKASSPAVAAPPAAVLKSSHPPMKCPMAGTFYRCPSPGSPPFVKVGDKVEKGQVICIIEAMKLMNEIEAEHAGTIVDVLVEDAKPVSVDLPLFVIEP